MSPRGDLDLICRELNPALALLRGAGMRLDVIYPADNPHTAILSHEGKTVRITSRPDAPPPPEHLPRFVADFVLTRGGGSGEGRAGMLYRDLIPGRLGGRYIASHITIPDGGPVSDWVHFHRIAFQLIYVRTGRVRVVYEDQGEPFVLNDGDMVLQPPEIRHRVLESSPGAEVIEIGSPAEHETYADHAMELPNDAVKPERRFSGQRFLRHTAADAPWTPFLGGEAQETAVHEATGGLAQVRTIRSTGTPLTFPPHAGELVFGFVLDGSARLESRGTFPIGRGDAFAIPPGEPWALSAATPEFRLLHVTTAALD